MVNKRLPQAEKNLPETLNQAPQNNPHGLLLTLYSFPSLFILVTRTINRPRIIPYNTETPKCICFDRGRALSGPDFNPFRSASWPATYAAGRRAAAGNNRSRYNAL